MAKTIDTLVPDIYDIIADGKEFSDESIITLAQTLAMTIKHRWAPRKKRSGKFYLRPSNYGHPIRKLYFDSKEEDTQKEWTPQQLLNFFHGDMYEDILLWLAKEAGHTVEQEQGQVAMAGLKGSMDAKIDGVVVDVKTTSVMNKFARAELLAPEGDPFGYVAQISLYAQADENAPFLDSINGAAFLAADKKGGLALMELDNMELIDPTAKIRKVRKQLAAEDPPEEKCYKPKVLKNGNEYLATGCQWCNHKDKCWDDLKVYQYKTGRKYFTHIEEGKEPPNAKDITEELRGFTN